MIWKIKLEADSEKEAVKYLKALTESFDIAVTHNLPLHHVFMEGKESLLTCERFEQ